ncbi:hypothetical protein [Paludibacterium denitrificans]|nr:hypothetical protein [Paludibacterium denitrificans]
MSMTDWIAITGAHDSTADFRFDDNEACVTPGLAESSRHFGQP